MRFYLLRFITAPYALLKRGAVHAGLPVLIFGLGIAALVSFFIVQSGFPQNLADRGFVGLYGLSCLLVLLFVVLGRGFTPRLDTLRLDRQMGPEAADRYRRDQFLKQAFEHREAETHRKRSEFRESHLGNGLHMEYYQVLHDVVHRLSAERIVELTNNGFTVHSVREEKAWFEQEFPEVVETYREQLLESCPETRFEP